MRHVTMLFFDKQCFIVTILSFGFWSDCHRNRNYGNRKSSFLPSCTCCLCHIVTFIFTIYVLRKLNDDENNNESYNV